MKNVGIIGLGLMGTSLALAFKKYVPEIKIFAYDKNKNNLDYCLENNIILNSPLSKQLKVIDVIFIAVPVKAIPKVIADIAPDLNQNTIISDLGSTKEYLCQKINKDYPQIKYIPGHPMAGRELSGPKGALADLFKNKSYIFIKPKKEELNTQLEELIKLIKKIKAKVILLNAQEHDLLVATTSHLPQLLASTLTNQLSKLEKSEKKVSNLVGQGFLDMTRIAGSNPKMWLDIFLTNKENILENIENIVESLHYFQEILEDEKKEEIIEFLQTAKDKRLELKENN